MALRSAPVHLKCTFPAKLRPFVVSYPGESQYLLQFRITPSRVMEEVAFAHFSIWPVMGGDPGELSHTNQLRLHQGMAGMLLECRARLGALEPLNPRPTTLIFVEHGDSEAFADDR